MAGPNQSLHHPLGDGGERLHEWAFGDKTDVDDWVVGDVFANTGATVMGRRMFSGGEGP